VTTGSVMLPRASSDTPIDTPVIRVDDYGIPHLTRIRSSVWDLGGRWVVKVDGVSGGYALDRIFVMP
jgi:hypothetical protein